MVAAHPDCYLFKTLVKMFANKWWRRGSNNSSHVRLTNKRKQSVLREKNRNTKGCLITLVLWKTYVHQLVPRSDDHKGGTLNLYLPLLRGVLQWFGKNREGKPSSSNREKQNENCIELELRHHGWNVIRKHAHMHAHVFIYIGYLQRVQALKFHSVYYRLIIKKQNE